MPSTLSSQSCEHNVLGIYLKEVAKRYATLAASETIGSKRDQLSRHPLCQALRQHLHIVRHGDKGPRSILQSLRDVRNLRRLHRMKHVPAFAIIGVTIKLFVTGHTPYVGSDPILFF